MLDAITAAVANNLLLIGLTVLFGTLAIWAAQDLREEETFRDAAQQTGGRARRYTGGLLGFLGVLVYAVLGTIYQTGLSIADFVDVVVDLVWMAPGTVAGAIVTVLAALGLEGVVPVSAAGIIGAAVILFGAAALAHRRGAGTDGGGR